MTVADKPAIEQAIELLERAHEAFSYMPCLHGAARCNIRDVRQEVNAALDTYWADLSAFLGRDGKS